MGVIKHFWGNPITGDMRFTFGYFPLTGERNLIAVLMGIFFLFDPRLLSRYTKKKTETNRKKLKNSFLKTVFGTVLLKKPCATVNNLRQNGIE